MILEDGSRPLAVVTGASRRKGISAAVALSLARRAARKDAGGVGSDDAILIARQALICTEKEQP